MSPIPSQRPAFTRVLIKLSGEILLGEGSLFSPAVMDAIASQLSVLRGWGIDLALVVGGGNILRGASLGALDRAQADGAGMLATVINGIVLSQTLQAHGLPTTLLSALPLEGLAKPACRAHGLDALEKGHIALFVAGTGSPFFTTDTAAALRALEIKAQVLLKGTKVDGLFDADPVTHPQAQRIPKLTISEALQRDLHVMDGSAMAMCRQEKLPIVVFNVTRPNAIVDVIQNPSLGSLVEPL